MNPKHNVTNWIALAIISEAVLLAMFAFVVGRFDPSVRTAVIVCITSLASTLVGIGGGLLGQQVLSSRQSATDLPPGSIQTATETTQTPPVTISAVKES